MLSILLDYFLSCSLRPSLSGQVFYFLNYIFRNSFSTNILIVNVQFLYNYFPGGSDGKSICLQCKRPGFDPWVGKIPWRRKWQHAPVYLPGKFHGQRSLVGYSPWGGKESDTTEWLHFTYFTLVFEKGFL